jgi:hypothetical protein
VVEFHEGHDEPTFPSKFPNAPQKLRLPVAVVTLDPATPPPAITVVMPFALIRKELTDFVEQFVGPNVDACSP